MVTDAAGIQWVVETQTTVTPIRFVTRDNAGTVQEDASGQFRAVLTSIMITQSGLFADFISELTVTASETLSRTVVQCSDGGFTEMNKTLTKAGNYYKLQSWVSLLIISYHSFTSPPQPLPLLPSSQGTLFCSTL